MLTSSEITVRLIAWFAHDANDSDGGNYVREDAPNAVFLDGYWNLLALSERIKKWTSE